MKCFDVDVCLVVPPPHMAARYVWEDPEVAATAAAAAAAAEKAEKAGGARGQQQGPLRGGWACMGPYAHPVDGLRVDVHDRLTDRLAD